MSDSQPVLDDFERTWAYWLAAHDKRVRAELAQQILDGIERDDWGPGDIAVICWHEVTEAHAEEGNDG